MKRRHRKIRSVCKWSGAVVTVLLVVIWVGSAWRRSALYLLPTFALSADSGQYGVAWLEPWSIVPDIDGLGWTFSPSTFLRFAWGFDFDRGPIQTGHISVTIYFPGWFLALLTGLPTAWLWYRERRRAPGLCINCGYDLRGAEHNVCPECGVEVVNVVGVS